METHSTVQRMNQLHRPSRHRTPELKNAPGDQAPATTTTSNKGHLVLDPFAGSATTLIAAQNNGRRWAGIDRLPDSRFHLACRMMGIRAKEAEGFSQRPDLADWLNSQLDQHKSHFRTEPPVRTDTENTATPAQFHEALKTSAPAS